jgi:hypothetical protein
MLAAIIRLDASESASLTLVWQPLPWHLIIARVPL